MPASFKAWHALTDVVVPIFTSCERLSISRTASDELSGASDNNNAMTPLTWAAARELPDVALGAFDLLSGPHAHIYPRPDLGESLG